MIVKKDIEKASDTLSWKDILTTLAKMNIPTIWLSWIHACISTTKFTFLINGHPTHFVKTSRCIRQGDLL